MQAKALSAHGVSLAFGAQEPLFEDLEIDLRPGWYGLVGANGTGKTTLLELLVGARTPDAGVVRRGQLHVVLCPQRLESRTDTVDALGARDDGSARRLRESLGLEATTLARWRTLSPGERKRWQIASALATEPDVLLLDEPTNHLDAAARDVLARALGRFRGIGVLVSHDRALLDTLTRTTLRLANGRVRAWDGPYGVAQPAWTAEQEAFATERSRAREEVRREERRLERAKVERSRAEGMRSAGSRMRDRNDSDQRGILAGTRADWAEARLARGVRARHEGVDRARERMAELAPTAKEHGRSVFLGYRPSPRPHVLTLVADRLMAGERELARDVRFTLGRSDRVRLAGLNGAGKTTLLRALLAASPQGEVLFVPQELDESVVRGAVDTVRTQTPEVRGRTMSLLAALGADPARVLASASPSPGEARKLVLALGLARHVHAVVLDEPTNHLDLPSIERLERALAAYPGALLVVTHDDAFARATTRTTWRMPEDLAA